MWLIDLYANKNSSSFWKNFRFVAVLIFLSALMATLFQIATVSICHLHTAFIFIFSTGFWAITGKLCYSLIRTRELRIHSLVPLGIIIILVNQLFIRYAVEGSMTVLFDCKVFTQNWLTYLISNNLLTNTICYTGFVYIGMQARSTASDELLPREPQQDYPDKILIKDGTHQFWLPAKEIIWINVEGNCITLFTCLRKIVIYQSLKSFSEQLSPAVFKKIHRSTVINTSYLELIRNLPSGDGIAVLRNRQELKISRTYKQQLG